VSVEDIVMALEKSPAIALAPDGELPMHLSVIGKDSIHVGRIRYLDGQRKKLSVWSVVDNVRSVAARGALSLILDYVQKKRGHDLPQ
jgi:aspartate-semialdehyde dehydrogenase